MANPSRPTTIDPEEGFRLWAETYGDEPSPLLALEERTLLPLLGPLEGLTVVDAGCGRGRWASIAAGAGARAYGFDRSRALLGRADFATLVQADLARPPFRACADLVICSLALSYADDPAQAFEQLATVVRPGGRIAVSDFHPEAITRGWKRTFAHGGKTYEIRSQELRLEAPGPGWILEKRAEAAFCGKDLGAPVEILGQSALKIEVWRARPRAADGKSAPADAG